MIVYLIPQLLLTALAYCGLPLRNGVQVLKDGDILSRLHLPILSFTNNASSIFAIGDIHADLINAKRILRMGKVVDSRGFWIAGSAILVQTGDIADRGPETWKTYQYFQKLAIEANEAGGQVICLLGNHEIMNLLNDLHFVNERDYQSFGGDVERAFHWSYEGALGSYLRTLDIARVISKTVFVHAGITPQFAELSIDVINRISRNYLAFKNGMGLRTPRIFEKDGPLWYRGYVSGDEEENCSMLREALIQMDADRMVVGHTLSHDGYIHPKCNISLAEDGSDYQYRLYPIDVGISIGFGRVGKGMLEISRNSMGQVDEIAGIYFSERRIYYMNR